MSVTFGARTDPGRVRDNNEDHYLVDRRLRLYVVCDGMGGHEGGEIASSLAVESVHDAVRQHASVIQAFDRGDSSVTASDVVAVIEDAVQVANMRVHARGQAHGPQARGMGTTLSLLLLAGHHAFIAHVGDSRIYRQRDGMLEQLTEDHSLVQEMARAAAAQTESFDGRLRHALTRAVGTQAVVAVDARFDPVSPRDRFLICSDGLHGLVADAEIAAVLATHDVVDGVGKLVDRANDAGGGDNITAVVVQVEGATALTDPKHRVSYVSAVRRSGLFPELLAGGLGRVVDASEPVRFEAGELLVGQGRTVPGLFFVVSGRIGLTHNGMPVGDLETGAYFGEDALFADELVSPCTVRATFDGPVTALLLTRARTEELQEAAPALASTLARGAATSMARRLDALARQATQLMSYYDPASSSPTEAAAAGGPTARYKLDTFTSATRAQPQPRPRGGAVRVSQTTRTDPGQVRPQPSPPAPRGSTEGEPE